MRVRGDVSPNTISIETYPQQEGYVEIRLRENITEQTEQINEQPVKYFDYDEYLLVVPNQEGLQNEIETNFDEWLLTGRTLEFDENASKAHEMRDALETLGVKEARTLSVLERKKEIDQAEVKATDLDIIVTEIMKLPYGQLKKVLTPAVMEVLEKYGYSNK